MLSSRQACDTFGRVAWGEILADAARYIAKALSEEGEDFESTLLEKIQAQLNSELDMPSSAATGGFVHS
jgi:hypothetical protein